MGSALCAKNTNVQDASGELGVVGGWERIFPQIVFIKEAIGNSLDDTDCAISDQIPLEAFKSVRKSWK